jgi:hypothetical protein
MTVCELSGYSADMNDTAQITASSQIRTFLVVQRGELGLIKASYPTDRFRILPKAVSEFETKSGSIRHCGDSIVDLR